MELCSNEYIKITCLIARNILQVKNYQSLGVFTKTISGYDAVFCLLFREKK